MIEYKSTAGGSDTLNDRLPSAPHIEGSFSLTWLWEVIVRTKRLPDDLDPHVLFVILRDKLRNPEREVRQHALRVLADLIPVIDDSLDQHMELILPELAINLSYIAPSVRKGAIDVMRIYLKHSLHRNEILRKFVTSVPEDSHLTQGLLMAIPYFFNQHLNEETLMFLINQLLHGTNHEFLRETSLSSLVKLRSKLGRDRFNHLLSADSLQSFHEMCKEQNIHLQETDNDDNVILETEITLETGPAITMKIHEEVEHDNYAPMDSRQDDSEPEAITRSPRKVRFGGEVVKMRTPESDSNQQSSDDNDMQTSVFIDRPSSIKITVHDGVTAIKTRHKSMIPVRITTGSNPTTPRKKMHAKRLHKSAPELRQTSKIPLRQEKKAKPAKNVERRSRGLRRPSRAEDALSPVPVHNEIEVFHNLTRSPERTKNDNKQEENESKTDENMNKTEMSESKETYPSFQVCKDDLIKENKNVNNNSPLNLIVRDLIHKEDTWTKNRALDDLVTILTKTNKPLDDLTTVQFIEALFACEKQKRLQNRAQEVLALIISRLNSQKLQELLKPLAAGLAETNPPVNIRLALQVMEKSSPRQFFDHLESTSENREQALRILIAAARTFPSSEINVIKGTQLAFEAMKDSKRGVRQAALETLASLAQVAGNTVILQTITEMVRDNNESEHFLGIVRTRLSRRQLPTIDTSGNIRYSSPREQEEFDWLCGGGNGSLSKTLSLNSIKIPPAVTVSNNYWKRNSRHESGKDYSVSLEDTNKEQVWAIDNSTFPKLANPTTEKATLCPVYVLHRESPQLNGKSYRNFDRGRSNSPPNRRNSNFEDINGNLKAKKYFRQNEQFKKSFSSEQIYNKQLENGSFSLSSRSSTTSTASSRSGIWLKEFRSGIPVPISGETKLKLRSNRDREFNNGPMLAQEPLNRTKLESPQTTPIIAKNSTPEQLFTPRLPPPSSGSESSGYFTPPPDHHLKDSAAFERLSSEDNQEPNFQIVDSENETQSINILRDSSASSDEVSRRLDEIICEEINHQQQQALDEVDKVESFSPLEDVNFDEPQRNFTEPRSKSRSETSTKSSLPEIHDRKNINSAPPLNEMVAIVPFKYTEISGVIKTTLPGSVTSNDNSSTKAKVEDEEESASPKRLLRRSISLRSTSIKRLSSPPNEFRPFTRPKEALTQSLTQMESSEWEIVMQGLNNLVRLCRNHPEFLEPHMHTVCTTLAKNIRNLRSQVARNACRAANELFCTSRRGLDMELEELAGPLLHRTADTNKFLRSDANAALDAMSLNLCIPRVVTVVANKGSTHQNGVVRAAATRLLSDIAMRIGAEKVYQLPKETRDKFLLVGANGLTEGSLDTRRHAKALMATLAKHYQFQKVLLEAVPQHTVRHITKIINSLK